VIFRLVEGRDGARNDPSPVPAAQRWLKAHPPPGWDGAGSPPRAAGADAGLGSHLKNYEWSTVPDSGHAIAWEHPDIFNEKVLGFVKRY
jgi:pimeloyl-ACP methyl ester carboxylesterase